MGAKTKNKSLPQESQKRQLKASTVQTGGNDDDDVCQHELAANEIEMKIARRERADDPRRSSYEAAAAPHYCALLMKSLLLLLLLILPTLWHLLLRHLVLIVGFGCCSLSPKGARVWSPCRYPPKILLPCSSSLPQVAEKEVERKASHLGVGTYL